jgi:ATP-dependent RNA helicase RhlE
MSFSELGLAENVLRAVAAEGYTTPTPIQSQSIPHLMAGRDVLGCAQTGTGKTAAFALPILHRLSQTDQPPRHGRRPIRVLILAPTRELASQIGQSFRAYGRYAGLRHTVVFGGVGQSPQTRALQQGVDILVATPGRLLDLMNQGFVDLGAVEIFVLDEADRMLDMGFLPDVRRIIARLPAQRQTVLFSATMPEAIEHLANAILHHPARVRIAPIRATTELISQSVYFVPRSNKPQLLADYLTGQPITRALVFTRTKHGADRVARQLNRCGIFAGVIHGNKSQSARQRTLEEFKSSRMPVLVATDLAARGIDVEGISHVFNYDLPHEPETYVHRIGRTGRAGASGIAVSFCDSEERKLLVAIERLTRQTLHVEKDYLRADPPAPRRAQRPLGDGGRKRTASPRGTQTSRGRPQTTHAGRRPQKRKCRVYHGL